MSDKPIFINYRRTKSRDKALILRWILEKEFGEGVSFLDEASIVPGQPWNDELKQALDKCHVLLALIHVDWHRDQEKSGRQSLFSDGDWIRQELAEALKIGEDGKPRKKVIPVLIDQAYLDPSGTDTQRTAFPEVDWLPDELQSLFIQQAYRLRFDELTPPNLSQFLTHVRAHLPAPWNQPAQAGRQEHVGYYPGVLQQVFPLPDDLAKAAPASLTPYVGLRPFRREDARLFYGRSREIYELCFKLTHEPSRLLLLDGYSGTGKSSLLQAGLIPRIEAKGWQVQYARREQDKIGGLSALLSSELAKFAVGNGPKLLILDQVEEVQTNSIDNLPREIPDLFYGLTSALKDDPGLKVILGFRSEFSAHLKRELEENFPDLQLCDRNNTIYSLERQGVIEAIRSVTADSDLNGVGKQFDLRFSPFQLPETIAKQLISSNLGDHIAPLLQVNMELLWQRCRRDDGVVEMTSKDVVDFIDTQEALLEHYLKKIRDQVSSDQVDDQRLLELLQYYVEEKPASAVRLDREFHQKFSSDSFAFGLREACKQLYLLYSQGSGETAITRLTHDSLAAVIHGRYRRLTEQKVTSRGAALFKNLKEKIDAQINSLQYREALDTLDEMMNLEEHRQELIPYLFELAFFWNEVQARVAERVLRHWLDSGLFTGDTQEQLTRLLAGRMGRDEVRDWLAGIAPGRYRDMQTRYLAPLQTVMVPIEGGEFMMGDETGDLSEAIVAHPVRVSSFCMGNAPVTNWQYGLYLFAIGEAKEQGKTSSSQSSVVPGSCPACELDWYDAVSYCNWLSKQTGRIPAYSITMDQEDPSNLSDVDEKKWLVRLIDGTNGFRLPTEAEWEYACRAGTTTKYSFGNDKAKLGEYGWYDKNSENRAHPVRLKKPNEFGLHDMHGNVWEWCQDWYGAYAQEPAVDPIGAKKGSYRVFRGGSWNYNASYCRSADRSRYSPDFRNYDLGFRLALVPSGPPEVTETSR